jgi:exo-beta-1,3-glucanase (GH17 family)
MSKNTLTMVLRSSGLLLLAALLVSCGGGGVVPGTRDASALRPLPTTYLARHAVCYEGYRAGGPGSETVTNAELLQDLTLLTQGNLTLLRLYNSDDMSLRTLQLIQANHLDIKVQLGCWINSEKYATTSALPAIEAANQVNIANCIAQANAYPDIVLAVSVGNENMVSWSGQPNTTARMAAYLAQVRPAISQPVTTDDSYEYYAVAKPDVLNNIDFVSLHTYAFTDTLYGLYDWKQAGVPAEQRATAMMAAALAREQQNFATASTYLASTGYGALPIVIGETGWKAVVTNNELERAHPVNQGLYYNLLEAWRTAGTGPKNIFWFEAFDEPWKGADDGWGLFNVGRQARYAVRGSYPSSTWEPGTYTSANATYYIPTVQSAPVSANRFTLYAETAVSGEVHSGQALAWAPWTWGSAVPTTTTAAEGTTSMLITPGPLDWGWGVAMAHSSYADDLSAFGSSGYLNFSVKTTYPGLLLFGFQTGNLIDLSLWNVFIPVGSGSYGYYNDGTWHNVKIPISDMLAWGGQGSGLPQPNKAALDLSSVTVPFVLADIYSTTGKAYKSNLNTPIYLDNIYWSK